VKYDIRKHIERHIGRLEAQINKSGSHPEGCWPWRGTKTHNGYGQFCADGHRMAVHRILWTLDRDRLIPEGLYILHRCEERLCCNPDHLYIAARGYHHRTGTYFQEVPEWDLARYRTSRR